MDNGPQISLKVLNSFIVKKPTFLSLTESPNLSAIISDVSFTMIWAAFPISSREKFSPLQIPLQLMAAY